MKSFLSLLLVSIMVFSLSGCTNQQRSFSSLSEEQISKLSQKSEIHVALDGDIYQLNPMQWQNANDGTVLQHLYEGLTKIGSDGQIVPGCADTWSYDTNQYNQVTYTFKLKDGLKWSDGSDLTASDFVSAWQIACDSATQAPYGYLLSIIENGSSIHDGTVTPENLSVKSTDSGELIVTLEGPCADFTQLVSLPIFSPVRTCEEIDDSGNSTFTTDLSVFNGPYKIESLDSNVLHLCINPYYYETTSLTDLYFHFYDDHAALVNDYQEGIIDVLCCSYDDLNQANVSSHSLSECYYLEVNRDSGHVTDSMAKAINMVLDRSELISSLGLDFYYEAANGFVPNGMLVALDNVSYVSSVLDAFMIDTADTTYEQAKALISDNSTEHFTILMCGTAFEESVLTAVADQINTKLGVSCVVSNVGEDEYIQALDDGNYDFIRGSFKADRYDPAFMLSCYTDEEFNDPLFDESSVDRLSIVMDAENDILSDGQVIPLFNRHEYLAYSDYLQNFIINGLGFQIFSYATFYTSD